MRNAITVAMNANVESAMVEIVMKPNRRNQIGVQAVVLGDALQRAVDSPSR